MEAAINYYERHIGDYLKDTAHLSLLEHGVYTRLIDVYYTREGAIPEREAARLIGARSKEERLALDAVLGEFFVLIDNAYVQKRCEDELHQYRDGQEGAEEKKLNDKERQRRSRERRKSLFEELRSHGVVPPWDTKTNDLQSLLSRVNNTDMSAPVTPPVTRDNTATQTPDTSNQTPVEEIPSEANASGGRPPKSAEELTKTELWSAGKSLLLAQGMPKAQCGSFVGRLVKDHGDAIVIDAVRAAVVEQPADAASWLKAACLNASGRRPKAGSLSEEEVDAINAREDAKAMQMLRGGRNQLMTGDVIDV